MGFGDVVTIAGANGFSTTGQGALDFGTYDSSTRSARQGIYAQTTYELHRNLSLSGGGDFEREQAFPGSDIDGDPTTTRGNSALWVEGRGTLADRFSIAAGIGHARIEGFASRYSPRLSVAAYLRTPKANDALTPSFNPAFPDIPIGNFSPLKGQRPFRRPANTGNLLVSYSQGPATVAMSGYFAGESSDSTFLGGSDINFGNSLLLPNENLNPGYQKMDVSASYVFHRNLKGYATIENVLNQHYEPNFGFPGLPLNVRAGVTITLGGR